MATNDAPQFPADRASRPTLLTGTAPEHRTRYWALSDHIAYADIRNIVADYINSSIPDAGGSTLWSAQPLESSDGHQRRLLTLCCGAAESLFITEYSNDEDDSIELEMTVHTAVPDGWSDEQLEVSNDVVSAARGNDDVWTWRIDIGALLTDDVEVDFGIDDDLFDDLAYALNVAHMKAEHPDLTDHSPDLAADLLAEAYRQLVD